MGGRKTSPWSDRKRRLPRGLVESEQRHVARGILAHKPAMRAARARFALVSVAARGQRRVEEGEDRVGEVRAPDVEVEHDLVIAACVTPPAPHKVLEHALEMLRVVCVRVVDRAPSRLAARDAQVRRLARYAERLADGVERVGIVRVRAEDASCGGEG